MADEQRELYDLEYKGCAERYERIYQATWTQFNYFLVAAGVLLGFGKDAVGIDLAGILACLALLFWFWATFEPLNRYGDEVARRAAILERTYNSEVFNISEESLSRGMRHFILYEFRRRPFDEHRRDAPRVRLGHSLLVGSFGIALTVARFFALSSWFSTFGVLPAGAGSWVGVFLMVAIVADAVRRIDVLVKSVSLPERLNLDDLRLSAGSTLPNEIKARDALKEMNSQARRRIVAGWAGLSFFGIGAGVWSFFLAIRAPVSHDLSFLVLGTLVILGTVLCWAGVAPFLFFHDLPRRSVRTSVRSVAAALHVSTFLLVCAQIGTLVKPSDGLKTDVHLRLDPRTGNVTITGEAPPRHDDVQPLSPAAKP